MTNNVISHKFIKSLSRAEWDELFDNGGFFNEEQCARLWRMEDRQTDPPKRLQLLVNRDDLLRLIREEKKAGRFPKRRSVQ